MQTRPEIRLGGCGNPGRREVLRRVGAGIAVCAFGGVVACSGRDPEPPLKIALQPFCGYQFMHLAEQEGWLPAESVTLRHVATNVETVAMLERGEIDGAALTLDEVLRLRDRGMPLLVVLVIDVSAGADVLLAAPGIERLADLRGRRIGVESSALGAVMLAKTLEAAGLRRDDVTIAPIDENHIAAWDNGGLDAILTYDPSLGQLERRGLRRIFDSRSLPQVILDVLAVRPAAAQRQPDGLRALIAGHFQAIEAWRNNPIDTAYRLAPLLGVEAEGVSEVFKGLDLPDVVYNHHYLAAPATELQASATGVAAILAAEGIIRNPPQLEHLFVADYLPGDRR